MFILKSGSFRTLDTRSLNVMSSCLGLVSLEEEGGVSIVCVRHLHHHSRPILWLKGNTHGIQPVKKNAEEQKLFTWEPKLLRSMTTQKSFTGETWLFLSVTP
jgi:hypothetical protein